MTDPSPPGSTYATEIKPDIKAYVGLDGSSFCLQEMEEAKMYCRCGCASEMLKRQHELRFYYQCSACGQVHWTDKKAKSSKKEETDESA